MPTANIPPDWTEAVTMAREFEASGAVIQVLVPVPRVLLEDRAYDLGAEVYEQVREAIDVQIKAYREQHG